MPEGGKATTPDTVRALHDSPHRGVFYTTGGGSLLLSDLLQVPGASATLLEAQIPYSQDALATLLGAPPEQACSAGTARDLAMCAYLRARELAGEAETFGFAITASLRSTRPKKGEHRAYCALQTSAQTHTTSLHLAKGARSREAEERLVADVALAALAQALGIDPPAAGPAELDTHKTQAAGPAESDTHEARAAGPAELDTHEAQAAGPAELDTHVARVAGLTELDTHRAEVAEADADMQALLSGVRPAILARAGDRSTSAPTHAGARSARAPKPPPEAILPGAFNPLHEGHRRMARAAAEHLGEPVAYELCIRNVDKPPLNFHDMRVRREQFGSTDDQLWLTNAATFVEKARVFGAVTFVVGADTMRRIANPKYYPDSNLDAAVEELADMGCRFLVFGRVAGDGEDASFVTLDDLDLPARLRAMSTGVSEAEFRTDISSTALRARRANDG